MGYALNPDAPSLRAYNSPRLGGRPRRSRSSPESKASRGHARNQRTSDRQPVAAYDSTANFGSGVSAGASTRARDPRLLRPWSLAKWLVSRVYSGGREANLHIALDVASNFELVSSLPSARSGER